jgi:hypothetical protein
MSEGKRERGKRGDNGNGYSACLDFISNCFVVLWIYHYYDMWEILGSSPNIQIKMI